MQNYELMYIISGEISDKETQPIREKVNKLILKNGSEIKKEGILGRRQLAYLIKKQKYGFYVVVNFSLQPENVSKLESDLKLIEEVIRYLITVSERPYFREKKEIAEKVKKKVKIKKERKKKIKAKEEKAEEEVIKKIKEKPFKFTQGEPKKEEELKEKKRMEELDKKLEEILHEDEESKK
jgi:small subunit ribosomal protein S6